MKAFWNQRYAEPAPAYGILANAFFAEQLALLPPGLIALPAEGQGRNAVHAARHGWKVAACDYSDVARDTAIAWARQQGVPESAIAFDTVDLSDPNARTSWLSRGPFDAVGVVFMHLEAALQFVVLLDLASSLRPGGSLILEVFSKEQTAYASGGPKDPTILTDPAELDALLRPFFKELMVWKELTDLDEGPYHAGPASVVRAVGRRA